MARRKDRPAGSTHSILLMLCLLLRCQYLGYSRCKAKRILILFALSAGPAASQQNTATNLPLKHFKNLTFEQTYKHYDTGIARSLGGICKTFFKKSDMLFFDRVVTESFTR